jgi:hypothetical protein
LAENLRQLADGQLTAPRAQRDKSQSGRFGDRAQRSQQVLHWDRFPIRWTEIYADIFM